MRFDELRSRVVSQREALRQSLDELRVQNERYAPLLALAEIEVDEQSIEAALAALPPSVQPHALVGGRIYVG